MVYETNAVRYQRSRLTAQADRLLRSGRVDQPSAKIVGDKTFLVTTGWIRAHATPAGGYKSDQLKLIGIRYPLVAGWMDSSDGRAITQADRIKFESFHEGYKATKKSIAIMASSHQTSRDEAIFGKTESNPVHHCGCTHVLPWDDCEHTDAQAELAMGQMLT